MTRSKAAQRPKLERYGPVTFAVVKTASYALSDQDGAAESVRTGDVMLFLGPR